MPDPIAHGIAKELAPSLYTDVKGWLVSLGQRVGRVTRSASLREFGSPADLLSTLQSGTVADGEWIRLKCKPSPFGRFLRTHFLTPIVGFNTELRLGPPIVGNHPVMGFLAHATSHLCPVGLFPPVEQGVVQACLYPRDAEACGMIGLFPGVETIISYVPALLSERHTTMYGVPSWVTGIVRRIDSAAFVDTGYSAEDLEVIRQSGAIWFFDATHDESRSYPIEDATPTDLWGGLYASGHLEIRSGELSIANYVDSFATAMRAEGFSPHVSQNQAGAREIALYSKGFRVTLGSSFPIYSLHMDAELSQNFGTYRSKFDRIVTSSLENISQACTDASVDLANPLDVDFTYTDSSSAYTVLKSAGASAIADPLAVSIRNWHRRRSTR
jgi:hypothetical protein